MPKLQFFILIFFIINNSFGQHSNIITDRPGETISAITITKKFLQGEAGYLKQVEKNANASKDYYFKHPLFIIRYGLSHCIELRAITEYATRKEDNVNQDVRKTGITNVELGAKVNFLKGASVKPAISLIAHYSFHRLRTFYKDTIDGANIRLAFLHNFTENFSLGYNAGIQWNWFDVLHLYTYTISPKFSFAERWGAFIELYGFVWTDRTPENSIDGGLSFLINDNFKVDALLGFGLTKPDPDKFFSIGASYRFNTGK